MARDGRPYSDVDRHQVFKFSHDGTLLLTVGQERVPGWDAAHFNEPTDVAIARDGSFYVSDGYRNARVAHFSAGGAFLNEWGRRGAGPAEFQIPHGVALDDRGRAYVADRENSRLQVFDTLGVPLRIWPSRPTVGRVFAVAVGAGGRLYVARKDGAEAVQVLDPDGRAVAVIPADSSVLATPHAIAVQGDSVLYIADTTGEHIRKFVLR